MSPTQSQQEVAFTAGEKVPEDYTNPYFNENRSEINQTADRLPKNIVNQWVVDA